MKRARIVEMGALAVIAVFVAFGGHNLLVMLNGHKPWGWLIAAGLVYLAVNGVRASYDPTRPEARVNVTKSGAYLCAAILALWAVLVPALSVMAMPTAGRAYTPEAPEARVNVTKAGAYLCAAILALWAVLLPARWVDGSCIVAVEIALVFDLITLAAPQRAAGGN